jgi:hypothetical protein
VIIKMLLENGANSNARGRWGDGVLYWPSLEGHKTVVKMLLDYGTDVNCLGEKDATALQAASSEGREVIVKMVNAQGEAYSSALQVAALGGFNSIIKMLLEHDVDVNVQGGKDGRALQVASSERSDCKNASQARCGCQCPGRAVGQCTPGGGIRRLQFNYQDAARARRGCQCPRRKGQQGTPGGIVRTKRL